MLVKIGKCYWNRCSQWDSIPHTVQHLQEDTSLDTFDCKMCCVLTKAVTVRRVGEVLRRHAEDGGKGYATEVMKG